MDTFVVLILNLWLREHHGRRDRKIVKARVTGNVLCDFLLKRLYTQNKKMTIFIHMLI